MTNTLADRVFETSTTQGTGTLNLGGAPTGFQTFVAGVGNGAEVPYLITDGTDWEVGVGIVTSGSPDTLSRATILQSSNADAAVNWGAGTRNVMLSVPAALMITVGTNNTFLGTNTFTGALAIAGTASSSASISLAEDTDNGTNKVTLQSPDSLAANYTLKLPTADGSSGQLLKTDGSGNLSFGSNVFLAGMKDRILNGLTMANGTDTTNDIDIAAGACVSDDGTTLMTLSAITKQLDAAWAVGTNQGGIDTGAAANTTYHMWVINRPDTDVTDVLFSTSASSPTMPTNYTKKKCIGSIIRSGGTILAFSQLGNEFLLSTSIQDVNATNPGTSAVTRTLTVPTGVKVWAKITAAVYPGTSPAPTFLISSLDQNDETPVVGTSGADSPGTVCSDQQMAYSPLTIRTNTSAQVRSRLSTSGAADKVMIRTYGWVDPRI